MPNPSHLQIGGGCLASHVKLPRYHTQLFPSLPHFFLPLARVAHVSFLIKSPGRHCLHIDYQGLRHLAIFLFRSSALAHGINALHGNCCHHCRSSLWAQKNWCSGARLKSIIRREGGRFLGWRSLGFFFAVTSQAFFFQASLNSARLSIPSWFWSASRNWARGGALPMSLALEDSWPAKAWKKTKYVFCNFNFRVSFCL